MPQRRPGGARGREQIVAARLGGQRELVGGAGREEGVEQVARDDGDAVPRQIVRDVLELGIGRDGEVRRDGPRGGGPDRQTPSLRPPRGHREAHVDGRARLVGVLDLGLGQRRDVDRAPVHRPLAAIERPAARKLRELADDVRLVAEIHRLVGMVPTGEDPEALEVLALQVDLLFGVFAAGAAEFADAQLALLRAELLVDLPFDGQTMAVPPRDEIPETAGHQVVLHHQILEDLVEEVPLVDGAVRVWRAVVEDELLRGGILRQELLVDLLVLPGLHLRRLALAERGAHGKIGLRQVDCFSVIHSNVRTRKGLRVSREARRRNASRARFRPHSCRSRSAP